MWSYMAGARWSQNIEFDSTNEPHVGIELSTRQVVRLIVRWFKIKDCKIERWLYTRGSGEHAQLYTLLFCEVLINHQISVTPFHNCAECAVDRFFHPLCEATANIEHGFDWILYTGLPLMCTWCTTLSPHIQLWPHNQGVLLVRGILKENDEYSNQQIQRLFASLGKVACCKLTLKEGALYNVTLFGQCRSQRSVQHLQKKVVFTQLPSGPG